MTATSSSSSPTAQHPPASAAGSRRRARALGVLGAAGAALGVWALAELAGVDLRVQRRPGQLEAVGPAAVLLSSLIASLAGWAALAVLERFTARARTAWTVLALLVLALSMGGPLTGGLPTGAKAALAGMHVAVAVVLVPVLRRTTR